MFSTGLHNMGNVFDRFSTGGYAKRLLIWMKLGYLPSCALAITLFCHFLSQAHLGYVLAF
jgi:hypothetical protein